LSLARWKTHTPIHTALAIAGLDTWSIGQRESGS
jgi:hypothetical protein